MPLRSLHSQGRLMNNLVIERLTVCEGRVRGDVRIADSQFRYASPQLMEKLLAQHPDLPDHTCVNDHGRTFAAVMNVTSIPHVLEHLVIDLQARAHAQDGGACIDSADEASEPTFVGTTEWVDEARGKARVEVSFTDDLVVLRAFRDASAILNDAMVQ